MDSFKKILIETIKKEYTTNPDEVKNVDIEAIMSKLTTELTVSTRSSFNISAPKMLKDCREQFSAFTERNIIRWKEAFDLLETHIILCTEAGENLNTEQRSQAIQNNDLKFDLLIRHHARACHIANEILCLLKNGFPDAAHARWRALHEVNVTAMFIEKHGQECARRFYSHDIVDSYDGMKEHKRYEDRLQEKAPNQDVIDLCKLKYEKVIKEFGKDFRCYYGWAAYIFPERSARSIGFATLEKNVGLDHMRPYYKWASQNIHAGSKGMRNRLALAECDDDVLVVGQSNSGMTDPAHATAISLMQVTLNLLKLSTSLDSIVLMNIIKEYSDEIGSTFIRSANDKNSQQ